MTFASHTSRRMRSLAAAFAALCLGLIGVLVVSAPADAANTSYYVDCQAGSNGSGTQAAPWNTLSSVNATTFGAGDRVLFKAGSTCSGTVTLNGSGTAANPARVDAYGSGAKPIISANGATGAVISLTNVQYWELAGLELRNPAASPAYRSGILAVNSSGTTLNHIWVTGMTISSISGWSGGWYSTNAGVGIQTNHTTPASTWNDIKVEGNSFDHVDRIAVAVTPDQDGEGTGLSTNVVIRNNTIRYSGGDDILVVKGQGALIEGNDAAYGGAKSISACPPSGQYCNGASAGIWMSGSLNTTVQGNSVVCHVNEADGQGYDVDWGNRNTLIQYNYSRNNRGGMILLMPAINVPGEPTSQQPSDGTVIRYNVSEDDASTVPCPLHEAYNGPRDVIHFAGGIPNRSGSSVAQPEIYNNTIYIPSGRASYVIGSRSGVNASGSFRFRNNLVVNYGTGGYVNTTGSTYANNIMYGNRHSTEPANAGTIVLSPQLVGPTPSGVTGVAGANSYMIRSSSPALRAGVTISGNGGRDFAGTTLPSTQPTIGAFEGSVGELLINPGFDGSSLNPWVASGSGTAATRVTAGQATGPYALQTGAASSGVEQVVGGLSPNTSYVLTGLLKVGSAGEQLALGVKSFGGTEVFSRTTSSTYALVAQYFTTGSSSTSATVYCYKNSGSSVGTCDALSLQRVSTPANVVSNSGFESGTLSNWTTSGGNAAATTVTVGAARTGGYGLATGASSSGAQQTVTGLSPSTTYIVTGWLRASGSEQVALGVKDMGSAESFVRVVGATYAPATVVFTTSSTVTSATVYCYKDTGSTAAACDDLRLTRVG